MYPLRPRMRLRKALTIVAIIWILGMIAAAPNLVTYTIYKQHFTNGDQRVICYSEWPDGQTNQSELEYIYNVAFMAITYFVPVLLMSYTYTRIAIRLWGSESIGEVTQRQNENIKSKRRVVKMLIIVVLIFVICWLPFHVYFIVTSKWPEITNEPYIQNLYLGIYWLAMSNSMYNPFIYCWLNTRFRQGFKEFFSCCPCINANPIGFTRRDAVTSRYNSCSGSPEGHYRIMRNGTMCIPVETSELVSRNDIHKFQFSGGRAGRHQTFRRWCSQDQSHSSLQSQCRFQNHSLSFSQGKSQSQRSQLYR